MQIDSKDNDGPFAMPHKQQLTRYEAHHVGRVRTVHIGMNEVEGLGGSK